MPLTSTYMISPMHYLYVKFMIKPNDGYVFTF